MSPGSGGPGRPGKYESAGRHLQRTRLACEQRATNGPEEFGLLPTELVRECGDHALGLVRRGVRRPCIELADALEEARKLPLGKAQEGRVASHVGLQTLPGPQLRCAPTRQAHHICSLAEPTRLFLEGRESEAIVAVRAWVDAILTGVVAGQRKRGRDASRRGGADR